MSCNKKAILVVSFGTSHADTRQKTIEQIENRIREAFPEIPVYRAWTSSVIRRILKKRDGYIVNSVAEAFAQMKEDGITEVTVQPTHILNGIEYDQMREEIAGIREDFEEVRTGAPLLAGPGDIREIVEIVRDHWKHIPDNEAVVFMGHGTSHDANSVYEALDRAFRDQQRSRFFIGTVEAYPDMEGLIRQVEQAGAEKVHLAPFMVVAGDHAKNDMAGDDEGSWLNQFKRRGFEVECHIEGLGEYEKVQAMYVRHVREA